MHEDIFTVEEIKKRHSKRIRAIPGVVGIGLTSLPESPAWCISVYTDREGVVGIPDEVDGVKVIVEVVGVIKAL